MNIPKFETGELYKVRNLRDSLSPRFFNIVVEDGEEQLDFCNLKDFGLKNNDCFVCLGTLMTHTYKDQLTMNIKIIWNGAVGGIMIIGETVECFERIKQ